MFQKHTHNTRITPWAGHPKGLIYLLGTEMCERFAFYIVQSLLVIYVIHYLGWHDKKSYELAGAYTALLYISPLLGGYLADHFIGQSRALLIGGFCLMGGYFILMYGTTSTMYLALSCIILGNGLYKPNVSTLVGNLYDQKDSKRQSGYTLFFIGFNLGAFISSSITGFVKNQFGWKVSFCLAAISMILATIIFLSGQRYIIDSFDVKQFNQPDKNHTIPWVWLIPLFVVTIAVAYTLLLFSVIANVFFMLLGIALLIYLIYEATRLQQEARQKMILLIILLCISVVFWSLYFQEFFSVNLFIDRAIHLTVFNVKIPAIFFLSLEPLFILILGPWFAKMAESSTYNTTTLNKFIYSLLAVSAAYASLAASTFFPGDNQLLHPYNIILFFFFITIGELLLYPIGMAAVIKLTPKKTQGFMMGAWFFTLGIGGSISGMLGELANTDASAKISITAEIHTYRHAFLVYMAIALVIAIFIMLLKQLAFRRLGKALDL